MNVSTARVDPSGLNADSTVHVCSSTAIPLELLSFVSISRSNRAIADKTLKVSGCVMPYADVPTIILAPHRGYFLRSFVTTFDPSRELGTYKGQSRVEPRSYQNYLPSRFPFLISLFNYHIMITLYDLGPSPLPKHIGCSPFVRQVMYVCPFLPTVPAQVELTKPPVTL